MKLLSTWCLLLLTGLFSPGLFGQTDLHVIHLRNGNLSPAENFPGILSVAPVPGEWVQGKYFRLIQFSSLPSEEEKSKLAALGVDMLAYYPYQTWLAALPIDLNRNLLAPFSIRSIQAVPVEAKLHDKLLEGRYPDHAWAGDRLQVLVQVPEFLDPMSLQQDIAKTGAEVLEVSRNTQEILVLIQPGLLQALAALPFVMWVESLPDPGEPEDLRALGLHRSSAVFNDHPMGRKYNGQGVRVMVRDDGGIGPHIDFQGRTDQNSTGGPGGGTHGDMVSGVFGGAGNLDPTTRGAAWGSFFYIIPYQPSFTDNTVSLHVTDSVMITNSSYSNGCNDGYTTITQRVDQQAVTYPSLMHMFSAGNSNNQDCGYGAGTQWGNITGGHKQGKNVMAVANLLPDGTLVGSSSRGPAHDGRIKPDVAANGNEQMSTDPFNAYLPGGGTSAASPSTAGVVAQLYQAYRELIGGGYPPSALIKAIVMNTAEDYSSRGPDFLYGWGRINALRAVKVLEEERYLTGTIAQGGTNNHSIEVPPGVVALKVMTYWMDPAASPGASIALVNDLDSRIVGPDGQAHLPWILNPAPSQTLQFPATKGADHLNNVEQVQIDTPPAGTYNLVVNGFSVPQGPQNYFVVIEYISEAIEVTHPMGGEGFSPGEQARIHWDAHGDFGGFQVHYSTDNGISWKLIAANVAGSRRFVDWTVPAEVTGSARVRVSRGNQAAISANPFAIIGLPTGLEIVNICQTEMTLTWNQVPGAVSYDVFLLGTQFMDSIGNTDATHFTVPISSPFLENWVAVRARTDNVPGRRSLAITNDFGVITCTNGTDLQVRAIPSIGVGVFPACVDTIRFRLEVLNSGNTPQSGFTVGYRVGNNPVQTLVVNSTLAPNALMEIEMPGGFASPFGVSASVLAKGFVAVAGDVKPQNDTLYTNLVLSASSLFNPPFTQAFETFGLCSTSSNCGGTTCALGNGWVNETNGVVDDIDWRVNFGTTPSSGTGPLTDHNPGTAAGRYLYLESSNNCNSSEAILSSPCVFLQTVQKPMLSVWYHMYGGGMGSLHIDIFDGSGWRENVAVVSGDQGDQWRQLLVDLSDLEGSFFSFRVRGITGTDFTSDIAIDNISVYDAAQVPVVDFSANRLQVCPGDEVSFSDMSQFSPDQYSWSFSPANVTFLAGSSAQSSSPILAFNQVGSYDVTLVATNAYGSDTMAKTVYVTANHGAVLPFTEDFQGLALPPAGWGIENGDGGLGWEFLNVTGPAGQQTRAARVNNYQYAEVGQEDLLFSIPIDLRTAISPVLSFDLAYALRNNLTYDELRVVISDNCGQSYLFPVYQKARTDLQTAPTTNAPFFPGNASQWRRDSLDLTQFIGQTISIGFVNLTGTGNNLYLDNINVTDLVSVAPQAIAQASVLDVCVGETITFSDNSTGNNLSYQWTLGPDATPGSLGFGGSFQAVFATAGLKTIVLTVSNAAGSSSDTLSVMVNPLPEASFTFGIEGGFQSYAFDNGSLHAGSYQWDFGDGTTSTDSLPTHTYTSNGTYPVTLVVSGACGTDTASASIVIDNVGIEGSLGNLSVSTYPNPTEHWLQVEVQGDQRADLRLSLSDLHGRIILTNQWTHHAGESKQKIDLAALPRGVYLLHLSGEEGTFTRRIVKM